MRRLLGSIKSLQFILKKLVLILLTSLGAVTHFSSSIFKMFFALVLIISMRASRSQAQGTCVRLYNPTTAELFLRPRFLESQWLTIYKGLSLSHGNDESFLPKLIRAQYDSSNLATKKVTEILRRFSEISARLQPLPTTDGGGVDFRRRSSETNQMFLISYVQEYVRFVFLLEQLSISHLKILQSSAASLKSPELHFLISQYVTRLLEEAAPALANFEVAERSLQALVNSAESGSAGSSVDSLIALEVLREARSKVQRIQGS